MTDAPSDAAAQWIQDVVLPPGLRDDIHDHRRHHCPCQYGPSGHCGNGNHERCPRTLGWHRHGQPDPDTWITDSRGMVAVARGVSAAVWRSGTPCRWLCPCPCHEQVMALFDAPAGGGRRPTRGNPIASTDRALADTPPQTPLWEIA